MSMESRSTKSRRRKPPDVFPHLVTRAPLARQANAARAQAIARMPDDRRIATLVAFVSRLERTACDDALNLMDLELAKLLTEADREGKAKRKKTLQTFDQAAVLLRDALLIVLDPTQEDLEHVREQLYARASHEELVKAVACVDQIAATRDASLRRTHLPLSIRPIVPA